MTARSDEGEPSDHESGSDSVGGVAVEATWYEVAEAGELADGRVRTATAGLI